MKIATALLLLTCAVPLWADEKPKRPTAAETEKKIRAAIKQAMSQAKKIDLKIQLAKDQMFLLPEIPNKRLRSISFQGIGVPELEQPKKSDAHHFAIRPEYLRKGKVIIKLEPDPGKKGTGRVVLRISVFKAD